MNTFSKFKAAVLAGLVSFFGIVGTAHAVNVNPDGVGQVLLYPYYTTNGGNMTILTVVNSTSNAKAVKVRFLEGQNSREVLDFNLYLSPYDVWAAAVSDVDGVPTLTVNDTSCTAPYLYENDSNDDGFRDGLQPFLPYAFEIDGGETDIGRASEGHFEVIEMGVVVDDEEDSAKAATHVDGFPFDCDQLQEAWTDPNSAVMGDEGYWLKDAGTDMRAPNGGLFGGAAIVNVAQGTMYSYNATAINGWADTLDANHYLHQVPGTILPSLNSGNITEGVVFLDNGEVYASEEFDRGVDALSFVLMHDQIMNEFSVDPGLDSNTEWVVTFPTKNFYVDVPRNGGVTNGVDPFTSTWSNEDDPDTKDVDESIDPPACEVVLLDSVWNREEESIGEPAGGVRPPVVSPSLPAQPSPILPFELCYETNIIRFGSSIELNDNYGTEIFGSKNYTTVDVESLGFSNGWLRLQLDDYGHDADQDGNIDSEEAALSRGSLSGLNGLPVIGFKVERFVNNNVDGNRVANYGGLYNHRATRKIDPQD